jgi:3-methyladenine DNA glycosylase AlkD
MSLARNLHQKRSSRWIAYELIRNHAAAFAKVDASVLEALGQGMASWWEVDQLGRILAGPAWLAGQVPDRVVAKWARSSDLCWRRAALVSTVELSDSRPVLAICRMLIDDREDMVVKALSWALRALARHDPRAVREFVDQHAGSLAALVKREVNAKLTQIESAAPVRRRRPVLPPGTPRRAATRSRANRRSS